MSKVKEKLLPDGPGETQTSVGYSFSFEVWGWEGVERGRERKEMDVRNCMNRANVCIGYLC